MSNFDVIPKAVLAGGLVIAGLGEFVVTTEPAYAADKSTELKKILDAKAVAQGNQVLKEFIFSADGIKVLNNLHAETKAGGDGKFATIKGPQAEVMLMKAPDLKNCGLNGTIQLKFENTGPRTATVTMRFMTGTDTYHQFHYRLEKTGR